MAKRTILLEGDPALRRRARPVAQIDERILALLDDMRDTMRAAQGAGLAAPQVGVGRRICIIEVEDTLYEMINPEILAAEGSEEDVEGCLSCPGKAGIVARPASLTVKAQGRDGAFYTVTGEGFTARAFAHEIDHLDGILYLDKVIRMLDPDELDGEEE